jgi:hypothetical protein
VSGAILDLQRAASDSKHSVGDLLRRALVIASKLGLTEFEAWVRSELNGYPPDAEVPAYRKLHGFPMALNPARGWVPIQAGDAALLRNISEVKVATSVTELEALLRSQGELAMSWPAGLATQFMHQNPFLSNPGTKVSRGAMNGVFEAVRNEILEWTLELERDDIRSEGLEFTEQERKAVQAKQHISNYYGPTNVAHVTASGDHATVNVSFGAGDIAAVAELAKSLREISDQLGLHRENLAEMKADVAVLEAQTSSPRPKPSILKSGLESVVRILGAAAVKEAAGPLMHKAAELLQRLQ